MLKRTLHIIELILSLSLAVTLAACGGGGSSAAPSGGGGTPVAVEIPALSEVANLPFTTGIVVAGSSDLSAPLKSTPWKSVTKAAGTSGNPFPTGGSKTYCEAVNSWRNQLSAWAEADMSLCLLQAGATSATTAKVDLYDSSYHVFSTSSSFPGMPNKFKVKVKRNSSKVIESYEMFACGSTTQVNYMSYTISGSELTGTGKVLRSAQPQRNDITISAKLSSSDPTQYTSKSGTYTYSGTNDAGTLSGIGDLTQANTTMLLDTWDSRGGGGNIKRIYAQADLTNPSSAPFDPREYKMGSGAGVMNDNGTTTTECWDGTSLLPVTCLDSNSNYTAVKGKTPKATSTVSIADFSGSNAWDCSGTSEFTFSPATSGSSACVIRFAISADHIDCVDSTQAALTVTPAVSGTTLSTNSGSPTSVTTTPSIVVTGSRVLDGDSVNSTTVTLVNTSTSDSVTLTYSNWSSDQTTFTLSPTLTSGQTYKLTLVGSSTTATRGTVIRAPGADPPKDQLQSTGTYYITAQ